MNQLRSASHVTFDSGIWMELDEAAAYSGVTTAQLGRAVLAQELPSMSGRPAPGRRRLVHRHDVEVWAVKAHASR